jgi:hypothetical protein
MRACNPVCISIYDQNLSTRRSAVALDFPLGSIRDERGCSDDRAPLKPSLSQFPSSNGQEDFDVSLMLMETN